MKHLLRGLFIAVLFICCNFQLVLAQPMQELPVDKNVRIGKLDNGLKKRKSWIQVSLFEIHSK